MLVLIAAVTGGLVIVLIFFGLNYVRMLGSHQEQDTAAQAAALAAAQDLSRIVVNTQQFGYVSLSDAAPCGVTTAAGDQYDLPVRSINTLIGTARLEYIIGDQLGDPIMQALSNQDLQNTILATNQLETVLNAARLSGAVEKDINNADINVYADAEAAYTQNQIRLTGKSTYKPGTMVLTLGVLTKGVATNIPVPQPQNVAPVAAAQQINGNYISESDITYKGRDFVFASVGQSSRLVDPSLFTTAGPQATQVPAVVRVDVNELISSQYHPNGDLVHAAACAQPGSVYDPKPAPGAFSLSFPDGPLPEIQKPGDVLTNKDLQGADVNLLTPNGGDYPDKPPTTTMLPMKWMLAGNPKVPDAYRALFYDWVRRAGTKANISSVEGMLNMPFNTLNKQKDWISQLLPAGPQVDITTMVSGPQIPNGVMHVYKFNKDGTIYYNNGEYINPWPLQDASENQMYGESLQAMNTKLPQLAFHGINLNVKGNKVNGDITFQNQIDVYLRDEVRQGGTILGGGHGGEPIDDPFVAMRGASSHNRLCMKGRHGIAFGEDAGVGGVGAKPPQTGGPGKGNIPVLGNQSDFDESDSQTPYIDYANGGTGTRPTYQTNGGAVDVRFRRQIKIGGSLVTLYIFDTGYLAEEF